MTTKQITPQDLEFNAALKLAQEVDLPSNLHEAIMILRKQTPLVRFIRMASIIEGLVNHLKKMNPTDKDIQFIHTILIVENCKKVKHYMTIGDIKGLNEINKQLEDNLIVFFDHQAAVSK